MKRILITGSNGYIGRNLVQFFKNNNYQVSIINRAICDLTDKQSVDQFFIGKRFDVLIHTAVQANRIIGSESKDTVYKNVAMLYNLLKHHNNGEVKYMIQFGSGAQLRNYSQVPYDMSKRIQFDIVSNYKNIYHLRIYNIFNHDEIQDRFIKNNINKYINKNPILIHQNKVFDFFYMQDFIKVVKYYVDNSGNALLPKVLDFVYKEGNTLKGVGDIINSLDDYKVPIQIEREGRGVDYAALDRNIIESLQLNFIGLEQGIKRIYRRLKDGQDNNI